MQHKNILAPISHLLTLERKDIIVILLLTIAVGILNLATPLAVQTLVNVVTMGGVIKPLIVVTFILFVLLMLSGLITLLNISWSNIFNDAYLPIM
jgi:ABC-type bacteriocin/lantibiotic exporter with double-glycine peptidase domain